MAWRNSATQSWTTPNESRETDSVILLEPTSTPYDLRWRMFGIPVRVHPMFWLMAVILGWDFMKVPSELGGGFPLLSLWVICVFVSILIHELGHVFMGQAFGSYGYVVLYGCGGLAVGSNQLIHRGQRIAVSFAGPLAQFLLLGVVVLTEKWFLSTRPEEPTPLWTAGLWSLIFLRDINLYWPILNLLPIWPLDGGQISRELFDWKSAYGKGLTRSLIVSTATAGSLALYSFISYNRKEPLLDFLPIGTGSLFSTLMFALLAIQSYQMLGQLPPRQRRW